MVYGMTSSRLRLRPCTSSDVPALMAGLNDWEIAQWMPGPPFPYTEADARDFIAGSTLTTPPDAFAVADLVSDELLGVVGLARNGSTAELGYWLLRHHQGKGLMREAIACLLQHQDDGLSSIFATVDRGNGRSIRLLEANGLKLDGEHVRNTPNRQGNTIVLRYVRSMGSEGA